MEMKKELTTDELILALRACADKDCKRCPIKLGFGCAQKLLIAAEQYVERKEANRKGELGGLQKEQDERDAASGDHDAGHADAEL